MKIYRRAAFMALPAGIIFAKGKPWYFNDVSVKGETIIHDGEPIDWCSQSLAMVDSSDSGELFKRLDEMLETGRSYPMEESEGRDGCFDAEDLFLVFEREDLTRLREIIAVALAVTPS